MAKRYRPEQLDQIILHRGRVEYPGPRVCYFMRNMPVSHREAIRSIARRFDIPMEIVVIEALTIGLPTLADYLASGAGLVAVAARHATPDPKRDAARRLITIGKIEPDPAATISRPWRKPLGYKPSPAIPGSPTTD